MNNRLGIFIKTYRTNQNMSLREFGLLCNISHTHIDSIEKGYDPRTGKQVNLTNHALNKLAIATGTRASHLLNLSLDIDELEGFHGGNLDSKSKNPVLQRIIKLCETLDENNLRKILVYVLEMNRN